MVIVNIAHHPLQTAPGESEILAPLLISRRRKRWHTPAAVMEAFLSEIPVDPRTADLRFIAPELVIEGLYWQTKTGTHWREIPASLPGKSTLFARRKLWMLDGVFERVMAKLMVEPGWDGYIDATFIEAKQPHPLRGWTKIGNGLKVQLVVRDDGRICALEVASANDAECIVAQRLLRKMRFLPARLGGDSAYDTLTLRELVNLLRSRLVTTRNWPSRKLSLDDMFERMRIKHARWVVERTNSWLKSFAAVKECYSRSPETYLAGLTFAVARYNTAAH